jgi:peptide/nickel transport system permease protein
MLGYIIRRIIAGVLVLVAVSTLTFALFFYGPADPAQAYCPETRCTPGRLEQIRENLGLNEPVLAQYATFMKGIVVGRDVPTGALERECSVPCLGISFKLGEEVTPYLLSLFPATLSVAVGAAVIFLTVGVGSGILAGRSRGTALDRGLVSSALVVNAVPYYLLALLAYILLVQAWQVFPETGYFSPFSEGPVAWVKGMLLVWLVLGISYSTQYARFTRGSMIDALNEDFVRTAKAKGLTERKTVLKHALRAAIVPIVTLFGLDFAGLLAGTIFTEQVFGIDGIGLEALDAIQNFDLPILAATILIAATFIVVANIFVDIMYGVIDPRVRLS